MLYPLTMLLCIALVPYPETPRLSRAVKRHARELRLAHRQAWWELWQEFHLSRSFHIKQKDLQGIKKGSGIPAASPRDPVENSHLQGKK